MDSVEGEGSTFILYVPINHPAQALHTQVADEQPEEQAPGEVAADPMTAEQETAAAKEQATPLSLTGEHTLAAEQYLFAGTENDIFKGRQVLIVDDDARNLFAVRAALESQGMAVTTAINGQAALKELERKDNFDLILMDIMMPEMDGYETMKAIRGPLGLEQIPIIALTAKAMKNDREKCLEAGASDYISKPLNLTQLFSLMRVWMPNE